MTDHHSSPADVMPHELASILPIYLAAASSSSDAQQIVLAFLIGSVGISRKAVDEVAMEVGIRINDRGDLAIEAFRLLEIGGDAEESFGVLHAAGFSFGDAALKGLKLSKQLIEAATLGV